MEDVRRAPELAATGAERASALIARLRALDPSQLTGPSLLHGWSRLTIACHLRYGTHAFRRMTIDTLARRPTSYYPQGREKQRPATLEPAPGERPADVLDDWAGAARVLDDLWATLGPDDWARLVVEPDGRADLGPVPLGRLAMNRLTETDVHGTDLDIGAPDWSGLLIEVALPTRLGWLASRRTNHRDFDRSLHGSWLLTARRPQDAAQLCWLVATDGASVTSRAATAKDASSADATITGTARDLLALLLGRPPLEPLGLGRDTAMAARFSEAFPGP